MNFSESYNSTAKAQIACRDTHDCESDNKHTAKGDGHYEQKPYNPIITVICSVDDVTLRTVKSVDTKFEILFDGVVMNRYKTLKIAESYFMDFTGISKAKYKKLALI